MKNGHPDDSGWPFFISDCLLSGGSGQLLFWFLSETFFGFAGAGWSADIHRMQALWSLDDLKGNLLACFQCLVAIHLYCRVMRKKVIALVVFDDEAVTLGIVEPLDLTACHAHIPLHQTPSLEYHPVYPS